ncbi:hypothetical protein [Miniphocaeibacter halophilus]|uniref:Uncharacterized protein n=1 Tax=Miniphocaeibacter halophilus TaxID=2931922 RepID=A0AC61MP35_9FIRM|nr:hypothetical protein [Miniphocaeibacter halophilus]QQK06883.1 hypothetical protein JFY71_05910 [Miniphocaeibacter halophilus]
MKKNLILSLTGIVLIVFGIFLYKSISNLKGILEMLTYILLIFGIGIFGHGMGSILIKYAIKDNPKIEKESLVALEDERNVKISNLAKAKAFDMTVYLFGAVILLLVFLKVEERAILILAISYVFINIYSIYYREKIEKKM